MSRLSMIANRRKRLSILVFASAAWLIPSFTFGADKEENPYVWQPKPKSVAVFKNGMGFFVRDGGVNLRDGWSVAGEVPPAAFGTLAIFSTKEDELVDIVGSGPGERVEFDGHDAPDTIEAKRLRFENSKGLLVSVEYVHRGQKLIASGKIISVGSEYLILESDSSDIASSPYSSSIAPMTAGRQYAVPIAGAKAMQVLEFPLRVHVVNESGKPIERTKLGIAYLRAGITWIPEYSLDIIDDDTAEITLRGTLINEAEDIVHGDVNFVVGVPNFEHQDHLAPIAIGQMIRTIGSAVTVDNVNQIVSNSILYNSNGSDLGLSAFGEAGYADIASERERVLGNAPVLAGPASTDYTVYTSKDLTVRKGEKAIVTLFRKRVKYSHIYRWSPPERIMHNLVLHNDTPTAWTTGPLLAMSDSQPLSEAMLKYTPKGGQCEIPVSTAINIVHKQKESEKDRELKAHNPSRDRYLDKVNLDGELMIKNFERTTVKVLVEACVPGRPTWVSDEGEMWSDPHRLQLLDRRGWLTWSVELEPQDSITLGYRYERWVPSQ